MLRFKQTLLTTYAAKLLIGIIFILFLCAVLYRSILARYQDSLAATAIYSFTESNANALKVKAIIPVEMCGNRGVYAVVFEGEKTNTVHIKYIGNKFALNAIAKVIYSEGAPVCKSYNATFTVPRNSADENQSENGNSMMLEPPAQAEPGAR